jgi:hypothetical protein
MRKNTGRKDTGRKHAWFDKLRPARPSWGGDDGWGHGSGWGGGWGWGGW